MENSSVKSVTGKIKSVVSDVKQHWKDPKDGSYVPYKEVVIFSGGGIGVKTVNSMVSQINMSATCLLVGSIYKLSPSNIFVLFVISNIISILKTPIVSILVDNTNTKMGKFRPYLLWAGIPCLIGVIGMTWLIPINGSVAVKMVLIALFYNILYVGQHIYNNAYVGISQVISPNSGERSFIMSISEFVSNLGPSIVQLVLPVFAQIFFGSQGLLDIKSYRILLPAFTIVGFLLGLLVMAKTKERVINAPKEDEKEFEKVSFKEGFSVLAKNKDFWIVSIGKLFDGFRGCISVLLGWICLYQLNSSAMNGILSSVVSTACVPGMLLAPILIKKLGYRTFGFASFGMNAVAALIMFFTFKHGVVFFVIALYLYNLANGPQYILQTSLMADTLDEQQLKTGKRFEGFVQNFQTMFSVIGSIISTAVLTAVYEHFGLAAGADGTTDYSVLTDAAVRNPIISWSIIAAMVAGIISAVPFLTCNMTSEKHDAIIQKLKEKSKN